VETLELLLEEIVRGVALTLEFAAVLCILAGFVKAMILLFKSRRIKHSPLYNRLRLEFGGWLVLALEFQLASDILKTAVAPTYEHLIQLGAIAIIRTFLNYFLSKELNELPELIRKNLEDKKVQL
jgi:uncharacterized membrane protein